MKDERGQNSGDASQNNQELLLPLHFFNCCHQFCHLSFLFYSSYLASLPLGGRVGCGHSAPLWARQPASRDVPVLLPVGPGPLLWANVGMPLQADYSFLGCCWLRRHHHCHFNRVSNKRYIPLFHGRRETCRGNPRMRITHPVVALSTGGVKCLLLNNALEGDQQAAAPARGVGRGCCKPSGVT